MTLIVLIISFSCFVVFLAAHFYIFHNYRIKRRFRTMAFIAAAALFLYSVLYWGACKKIRYFPVPAAGDIIAALFAYGFFAYFYFMHVVLVTRSITTRLMVEMALSPDKCLTMSELKRSFSYEKKLETELEDMQVVGRIVKEGGCFRNTRKGRFHARMIGFLRNHLNLNN